MEVKRKMEENIFCIAKTPADRFVSKTNDIKRESKKLAWATSFTN